MLKTSSVNLSKSHRNRKFIQSDAMKRKEKWKRQEHKLKATKKL